MKTSRNSLFAKVLFILLSATLLEGIFFIGSLKLSRSFENVQDNSISLFEQRIQFHNADIHKSMVDAIYKQSNYTDLMAKCQSLYDQRSRTLDSPIFQEEEVHSLIALLQSRNISGAFIVLDADVFQTKEYPTLYLKDSAPDAINNDLSDISGRFGDATLLKGMNLSLEANWSSNLPINKTNPLYDFYNKPFHAAMKDKGVDSLDYGYWGKPIAFDDDMEEMITFSFPLIANDGTVYGVLGVDMNVELIKNLLDYQDLNDENQKAMVLASKKGDDFSSIISNGPAYSYKIKQNNKITLDQEFLRNTYSITLGDETGILASSANLELYPRNSPFEDENWYLIGIVDQDELLRSSMALTRNGYIAIALAMLIGICAAIWISIQFTKPIKRLVKHVSHINTEDGIHLPRVKIDEIDELSTSIEELSQNLLSAEARMSQVIHATKFPVGAIESFGKDTYFITEMVAELLDFPAELQGVSVVNKQKLKDAFANFVKESTLVEKQKENIDQKIIHTYVYRYRKKNHEIHWFRITYSEHDDNLVFIVMDVTKEFIEKERLIYERDHDSLTTLLNRNAFQYLVEKTLKDTNIGTAAMVLWDLDNLKFINDTYGHDSGDLLIKTTANILAVVNDHQGFAARMAGDEFLIFLHHFENKNDLYSVIHKLHREIIGTRIKLNDQESINIKVSAGIAWYPDDANQYETLLKAADFAMYDVKNSQKGSIRSFNPEMYQRSSLLFNGRKELSEMLERRLVRYAYQPIINAKDGSILGFEALMRPQGKILRSPQDVLRLARAQSQLYKVEYMTWTMAMEQFSSMEANFPSALLFINSIPSIPLLDDLMEHLEKNHANILPRVVVELLESDEIEHTYLQIKQNFMRKWHGCFAIDDFGSGYSSDSALLNIHTDYIKIDIELIHNIHKDIDRQLMVRGIIDIAHQKQIKVIAEGVELKEEMEMLITMNVDYLQGYYLAKPDFSLQDIDEAKKAHIRAYQKTN